MPDALEREALTRLGDAFGIRTLSGSRTDARRSSIAGREGGGGEKLSGKFKS